MNASPRLLIALALVATASPVAAQTGAAPAADRPPLALTLDDAVRRALSQGEEMRVARAQVLDADGQIREAWSGALPQVTGTLTYTRQFASIYQGAADDTSSIGKLFKNTPFGAPNLWSAQIQATQLVWSGGKVGAGLTAARAVRAGAAAQQAQAGGDVRLAVTQAYLDAAAAARLLDIAAAGLTQARDHEHQVRLFHQAGTRADYDLLRAQVDAANQEPAVVAARNAADLALRELKRLINVPDDQPLELVTALLSDDATIPVLAGDSLDATDRPAIAAAEAAVRVQEQAVKVARADRWPSLSLATTYSEQAFPRSLFPDAGQFRRGWTGEVRLNVPIFLGFRTSGTIERARAGLLRAQAERDRVREQAALDVAQARSELERTRALLVARRETVVLAERTQHLAAVRYNNGLSTELEVADARVQAQQAEVNEVTAARDYLVALAQLERALGRPVPVVRRPLSEIAQTSSLEDSQP